MDLFSRKRIKHLEGINAELRLDVSHHLTRQIELAQEQDKLIRDIREMDQLVYQMQTSGNPDQLRSAIQRAWAITETRMRAESKRIESVMIPEIKKAYLK